MNPQLRTLLHPRDEIVATIERIYRYRMTTTSGGNLSIKDEAGDIWITPARVDKGNLRREDIMRSRADGSIEGPHKPSSEYPFHAAIYRTRPDIRAIVHAHPVVLVSFSICRQIPNTAIFRQAAQVCGKVDVAAYELPGSQALGDRIAEVFSRGADCVLLENHGVVIGGTTLADAFQRFETLEFTAKTIIKAKALGPVRYLTPDQIARASQPLPPLPEADLGSPTSAEKAARRDIVEFVRRGYRQRLMTATQGSFSVRIDASSFAITGYKVDRGAIDLDEIALVRNGRCQTGSIPSRAVRMHETLYHKYPSINAIVNAFPVNATAFSVTQVELESAGLFLRATFSCVKCRWCRSVCSSGMWSGYRNWSRCASQLRCLKTTVAWCWARVRWTRSIGWRCWNRPPMRPSRHGPSDRCVRSGRIGCRS